MYEVVLKRRIKQINVGVRMTNQGIKEARYHISHKLNLMCTISLNINMDIFSHTHTCASTPKMPTKTSVLLGGLALAVWLRSAMAGMA